MKNKKNIFVYLVFLIIYYLVFNNISLIKDNEIILLFLANSSYSIENNSIILNNFIVFTTLNLFILVYVFNIIDELINMKNYIKIRTKKFSSILVKIILNKSMLFILVKIILDFILIKGSNIKDILIINLNILLSLLIYCFLYLLLSLKEVIKKKIFLLIIFLNLSGGLIYYKFNILKIFVYLPGRNNFDINISIINKIVFLIILFILIKLDEDSKKYLRIKERVYDRSK